MAHYLDSMNSHLASLEKKIVPSDCAQIKVVLKIKYLLLELFIYGDPDNAGECNQVVAK